MALGGRGWGVTQQLVGCLQQPGGWPALICICRFLFASVLTVPAGALRACVLC
jgi:hypothetical protein